MSANILEEIGQSLYNLDTTLLFQQINTALTSGVNYMDIVNHGLMIGLNKLGNEYSEGKIYIADMLSASAAFEMSCSMLLNCHPVIDESSAFQVVIGTVSGDLHETGKNLARYMMQSYGIRVLNLGTNVKPSSFAQAAKDPHTALIICSATLTSSAKELKKIVNAVKQTGMNIPIMAAGTAFNSRIIKESGADRYLSDVFITVKAAIESIASAKNNMDEYKNEYFRERLLS